MSSGSSGSARSSPSSAKFQSNQHHQQYSSDAKDNFVIPGQSTVRFLPHQPSSISSSHIPVSPTNQSLQQPPLSNQSSVHHNVAYQQPMNAIYNQPPAGFRRSSDATDSPMNRPSSASDETSPPIAAKPARRFSLAQALSNINHNSSSSGSLMSKSLSKTAKGSSKELKELKEERRDSVIAPLKSDSSSSSSNPNLAASDSPTANERPGGRKGSTTSITSTGNSGKASASNGGAGKRRGSRIAFFSHRLGSEAIPDMKSLSVSSSSGGKNQGHHFLPNLLGHGHENRKPSETYRLVVLGGSRVGKTAIVQRFLYNTFPETHSATVEELHRADYEVKGLGIVGVEILDTSGSFPFPAMQRLAISSGHAFILVYSVDDKESFEEVSRLRELVISVKSSTNVSPSDAKTSSQGNKKGTGARSSSGKVSNTQENDLRSNDTINDGSSMSAGSQVPLVIVANKSDLDEDERQVGTEMAECECIDWDVAFVESSAKTGDNVMNIFHKLLLQAHLKGILRNSEGSSAQNVKDSKLKVEKVPKVSNRRRSSLPVNDLFHSTGRHLPLFGKGGHKDGGIKEGEVTDHSASGGSLTSPTASAGDHSSRSSCALS